MKEGPFRFLLDDDAITHAGDDARLFMFLFVPLAVSCSALYSAVVSAGLAASVLPPFLFFIGGRVSYTLPLRAVPVATIVAASLTLCGVCAFVLGDPAGAFLIPLAGFNGVAVYGGITGAREYQRGLAGPAGECSHCRYNLAGLPAAGICPECGQRYRVPPSAVRRR